MCGGVAADRTAWPEVLAVLTERFALPFDDARLVMDRVEGGIVGAGAADGRTGTPSPLRSVTSWTRMALTTRGPSTERVRSIGSASCAVRHRRAHRFLGAAATR